MADTCKQPRHRAGLFRRGSLRTAQAKAPHLNSSLTPPQIAIWRGWKFDPPQMGIWWGRKFKAVAGFMFLGSNFRYLDPLAHPGRPPGLSQKAALARCKPHRSLVGARAATGKPRTLTSGHGCVAGRGRSGGRSTFKQKKLMISGWGTRPCVCPPIPISDFRSASQIASFSSLEARNATFLLALI